MWNQHKQTNIRNMHSSSSESGMTETEAMDSALLSQNSNPESPDAIINALKPEITRARQALTCQDELNS